MTYTQKGLVNDTIGFLLKPYKVQEFFLLKQYGVPYTTYFYSSYGVSHILNSIMNKEFPWIS